MSRLIHCAMAATLTLAAQTPQDFRTRHGEAYIQRYRIDDQSGLTVRYGDSGQACAFRIAGLKTDKFGRIYEGDLDSGMVDRMVERLVPGYTAAGTRTAEFEGWRISYEYRDPAARDQTISATLVAGPTCSDETRSTLRQQYGSPEYERFMVEPGMMLVVSYGKDQAVKEVGILRRSTEFHGETYGSEKPIDAPLAERLLDEILTPAGRLTLRPEMDMSMGQITKQISSNGTVSMGRVSNHAGVLEYSIDWQ
jgi:hypothetical protein